MKLSWIGPWVSRIDWCKGNWCGITYMVVRLSKTDKQSIFCVFRHNTSSGQIKDKCTHQNRHSHRCRGNNQAKVPEKLMTRCTGFTYFCAKLFNRLPNDIKETQDVNSFKGLDLEKRSHLIDQFRLFIYLKILYSICGRNPLISHCGWGKYIHTTVKEREKASFLKRSEVNILKKNFRDYTITQIWDRAPM